ncbi:MAG: MlaD family protein [Candidatus Puniceispirillaceae bacterium]
MKIKSSDFIAGIFVIAGLVTIIAMFVVVRGQFERQDSYHSYFNNVAGLRPGASVIYEGYIIGTVEDITPEATDKGMTFRVDLGVTAGWAIPRDSMAEISALSLLSAQSIQIVAGQEAALAPGDLIPSRPASNLMLELGRTADQFAEIASTSLVPLLITIEELLNEEARDALSGLTNLTASVNDGVPAILEKVERTAGNLETASQSVAKMAGNETQEAVTAAIGDMLEAADNINDASLAIKTASDDTSKMVIDVTKTVENTWITEINGTLTRIDNAAMKLEDISQSVLTSAGNIEELTGGEIPQKIKTIIENVEEIRGNLAIASESVVTAADNAAELSDISEDRIEAFLQKLENAALNVEEMTARLRDDPSIIIRGSN